MGELEEEGDPLKPQSHRPGALLGFGVGFLLAPPPLGGRGLVAAGLGDPFEDLQWLPGLLGRGLLPNRQRFPRVLLGIGEPLIGRFLIYDALKMKFREMKLRKDPECPVCGTNPTVTKLIDYEQFCGMRPEPHEPAAGR